MTALQPSARADRGNMTEGGVFRKILWFALPMMIGNLLQELYGVFDTLIVGRTLGVGKLAAVGATGPLTFFVVGLFRG